MNRVVAHFLDGRVVKGETMDFTPAKDRFHLVEEGRGQREVALSELKGLYFVRELDGDLGHAKSNIFDKADLTPGRRIQVRFKDGEVMNGTTQGYQAGRTGFFVVPADRKSNTLRAYILTAATEAIAFL